jgi:hypothetical protein
MYDIDKHRSTDMVATATHFVEDPTMADRVSTFHADMQKLKDKLVAHKRKSKKEAQAFQELNTSALYMALAEATRKRWEQGYTVGVASSAAASSSVAASSTDEDDDEAAAPAAAAPATTVVDLTSTAEEAAGEVAAGDDAAAGEVAAGPAADDAAAGPSADDAAADDDGTAEEQKLLTEIKKCIERKDGVVKPYPLQVWQNWVWGQLKRQEEVEEWHEGWIKKQVEALLPPRNLKPPEDRPIPPPGPPPPQAPQAEPPDRPIQPPGPPPPRCASLGSFSLGQ